MPSSSPEHSTFWTKGSLVSRLAASTHLSMEVKGVTWTPVWPFGNNKETIMTITSVFISSSSARSSGSGRRFATPFTHEPILTNYSYLFFLHRDAQLFRPVWINVQLETITAFKDTWCPYNPATDSLIGIQKKQFCDKDCQTAKNQWERNSQCQISQILINILLFSFISDVGFDRTF